MLPLKYHLGRHSLWVFTCAVPVCRLMCTACGYSHVLCLLQTHVHSLWVFTCAVSVADPVLQTHVLCLLQTEWLYSLLCPQ